MVFVSQGFLFGSFLELVIAENKGSKEWFGISGCRREEYWVLVKGVLAFSNFFIGFNCFFLIPYLTQIINVL